MILYLHFTGITVLVALIVFIPLFIYIYNINSHNSPEVFEPVENPMNFDDLAPIDNAEQSEAYIKALRWALSNPKITNIAITGPYGSGKSSLLQTFKKKYPDDFKYLDISLASFSDQTPVIEKPNVKKTDEETEQHQEQRKNEAQQLIELSVLQQIFYKVNEGDIPESRFKRISVLPKIDLKFIVAGTLAFLFSLMMLVFPKQTKRLSFLNDFSTDHSDLWFIVLVFMLLPGLLWLISFLIRFSRNTGIKKLNISSGEIEIDPKSEASILNRYLDELVYFFSATRFNVVLIEDMDRFNDPEIFTKLRELNTLLNSSGQVGRRITFIYAIRDNMFPDDRTRTKFFDFIVPVIPVINWSNSLQKLTDKLDHAGFKIEHRFITSVTLYIDDMRVLKNIFNELILYKESLTIPEERQTKLLAMIAYKNIYPNDFAALHEEEGIVYDAFNTAQAVRNEIATNLNDQISLKKQHLNDVQALVPHTIKELRAIYIQGIIDELTDFSYFYLDNVKKSFSELQEEEIFKRLISGSNVRYVNTNQKYGVEQYKFSEIEAKVYPGISYEEREKLVQQKSKEAINALNLELKKLLADRAQVNSYSLSEIIKLSPQKFPELDEGKKENRLLRYLLWEGYIDQTYPYLISYFYPGTIGRADMKFLTYVNDRIPLPFDYALEKPEGLIGMLADYDFEREVVLNIQLLDTLLDQYTESEVLTKKVIAQLNDSSKRGIDFISVYIAQGKHVPLFIKLLCQKWHGVFTYFFSQGNDSETDLYLKLILEHSDLSDITAINVGLGFSKYVNARFELLASFMPQINVTRMGSILDLLAVNFEKIAFNEQTSELFDTAYLGNHYKISIANIEQIIENKNTLELGISDLKTANYSTIINSNCEELYNYIDQEISIYLNNVLLKLPGNLNDLEKDIIYLLNDEDLSSKQKESLLLKETVNISKIEEIEDTDLHPYLFAKNKIAATWENVLFYFQTGKVIDNHLLSFLNYATNATTLGKIKLISSAEFEKAITDQLEQSIILNNDIDIDAYKLILTSFNGEYNKLNTTTISSDKANALIDFGLIAVNVDNFEMLKGNKSPLHISLLLRHPQTLFDNIDDFSLDSSDRLLLLKEGNLGISDQLKLIETVTPTMINTSRQLATRISEILVKSNTLKLEYKILKAIITYGEKVHEKLVLFEYHLSGLNASAISELLAGVKGDYARLNAGGRPTFLLNSLNQSIATQLANKRYISSYKIDPVKKNIRMNGKQQH